MKKIFSHKIILATRSYVVAHKKRSIAGFLVLLILGYWGIGKLGNTDGETKYVLAAAEKNTIIVSISGSGQVSSSNQVDLKAKTSGDVVYLGVKSGQEVWAGALLIQLDARDAQKAVRDAEANLESAQLSLEKLKKTADDLAMLQSENSLTQANESLNKSYDDGFNAVSNAYLDLPNIMTGFEGVIYGTQVGQGGQGNFSAYADMTKSYSESDNILNFKNDAVNKYSSARKMYEENLNKYKTSTRFDGALVTENLISQNYELAKAISDALKSSSDFLNLTKDVLAQKQITAPSALTSHLNVLAGYISQTNTHSGNLLSIKNTIASSKRSIAEKTASLAKLKEGADFFDLRSQELSLRQRQNALLDAQEKLADAFIRAPFDGVVAKVNVKKLDAVSSGAAVAIFITKQKLAEISLNEVDIAKVKVGQKATLTFDAVEDLSISGEVAEVDAIGTVSQGVVNYNVKIAFDTQDDRIKPGMSVSASIITDVKQDVLVVPISAIKSSGNDSYVEILDQQTPQTQVQIQAQASQGVISATAPRQQSVEIGVSNDTQIEIISGLKEGDQIIVRTVSASASTQTAANQAPSLFGGGSRSGSGGNVMRIAH